MGSCAALVAPLFMDLVTPSAIAPIRPEVHNK